MKSVLKLTTRPLVACCWHLRRATCAGVPTCADARLNKILRETWGYTGYITSDTDAVGDIFSQHK
jgi:beta-glucosidase-like glycosyl hydrolase